MKRALLVVAAASLWAGAAQATILTWDQVDGIFDRENVPDFHGDFVASSPEANEIYGVGPEGFTPNVAVSYFDDGTGVSNLDWWTTGFGDHVNVLFNDDDGDAFFGMRLTADPGWQVSLESFELSSFLQNLSTDVQVSNPSGVIFDSGEFLASQSDGHYDFAPANSWVGQWIEINVDTSRLGSVSDDIGLDNVTFSQFLTPRPRPPSGDVPLPAAAWLLLGGLGALAGLKARRKA